jgi:fibronectin type 3 domain-containing protein
MKMNFGRLGLAVCLIGAALSSGCGTPGIPEPPSLELARPVRDLKAVRKGNEVHLAWSVPDQTEDRQTFRHAGPTRVCRNVGTPLRECKTPVAQLPPQKAPVQQNSRFKRKENSQKMTPPEESYTDQLSSSLELQSPTSNVIYAVSVLNSYGRSAGLSNQVEVPSAPTLPPPQNLNAQMSAEGVKLEWSAVAPSNEIPGLRYEYRVYRRDVASNHDAIAGEVPVNNTANPSLLDTGFDWEKTYDYRVTAVTVVERTSGAEQVEGDDTPPIRVVAHDVFPPAAPAGLQAVFSGPGQKPFIDLVWVANGESDLAGYNVYRHEAGAEPVKINTELLKTSAFRDASVIPGHQYFYSVSAMDARGNESAKSEEASETVPAD